MALSKDHRSTVPSLQALTGPAFQKEDTYGSSQDS